MKGRWKTEDVDILRSEYPDTPTRQLADRLSRKVTAVYQKAKALGLKKSAAYMATPAACHLRRGNNAGSAHWFRPGHRPHNAGKKGWQAGGDSWKTQFKPGMRPHTWRPIGSERVSKDGYLLRKITDTGYKCRDWVGVHKIIWEAVNGPIPKGHVLRFRDGNQQNICLENLGLLTRAEQMRRNCVHNLPKELAVVIQLKGALQRQINKRESK